MKSVTTEYEWRKTLDQYPVWFPPKLKTIIVTPHPDDETLGAGGLISDLISQSIDVTLVSVTDGENAYDNEDRVELAKIRSAEQIKALSILGMPAEKIIRLGLTDSNIAASEHQLENFLLSIIDGPVSLLATWTGDFHPDHEVVGRVSQRVAAKTHSSLAFYFFWTWHRGDPQRIRDLSLRRYSLSDQAFKLKQEAIQCYHSQLAHKSQEPILPQHLLLPTQRPYEVFLPV